MRTIIVLAASAAALAACVHDNPRGVASWDQNGKASPEAVAGGRGLHDSYRRLQGRRGDYVVPSSGLTRDADGNLAPADINGIDRRSEIYVYLADAAQELCERMHPRAPVSGPGEVFEKGSPRDPKCGG